MKDKAREFIVTRTIDGKQLGLTALIESLQPGETKAFVDSEELESLRLKNEKLVSALKYCASKGHGDSRTECAHCVAEKALAENRGDAE